METLECITTRKSVRRFRPDPIPEEDIITMLEAAAMAPSGANQQPWKFFVVRSRSRKEEMVDIVKASCEDLPSLLEGVVEAPVQFGKMIKKRLYVVSLFFAAAPVVFVVCVKQEENSLLKCYTNKGVSRLEAYKKFGYTAVLSCSAAIENLLLAACDLGYGTCWMNIPFMAKDALEDLFAINPPWEILALVPVGIPAHDPRKPKRKKLEEISVFIDE
ncbi:MAG: nitroreductase family protein [Theionarchaea archaeon]|nr:MAG: hypothetical protein AYK19_10650 [Theionarchaea archaeon DG-70-1]MBU7027320.1 nitroreductase family protein [Theionarchaea archaeon]